MRNILVSFSLFQSGIFSFTPMDRYITYKLFLTNSDITRYLWISGQQKRHQNLAQHMYCMLWRSLVDDGINL